ncbi:MULTISPECIES: AAA family ATPase [Rhodomicrobium]|uniref:AAA family ATPase n=1 Tax=Rhodomicrobium TaxID=1068 RepID=UPI000B4BBC9A|nr:MULTISPECIES: AAA family ATPase [Rhodomicrobium]
MPATMRILGWKAEGLRCPDHEIDCCDANGQPHGISLIQMPNGTGKTTTLSLLRAALSGAAANGTWDRGRVRELRKKGGDAAEGLFELKLTLNDKRITVKMEFDFETGRVEYKTTWGSGQEEGFNPPFELRRFMNEDFVNFYVFDGELAENLLNKRHTDAEQAVESLFQVHLLNRMADKVSAYWDEQTRSVTAKDETGYTRRKNRLEAWRKRHSELVAERSALDKRLAETSGQLIRQEERYKREITKEEDRAKKIGRAESIADSLRGEVREGALSLLDEMRDPQALSPAFAAAMFELKSGLDRAKLPESAAREFFEDLAKEDECVCGRIIDDEIRTVIRTRAKKYLGSDDVNVLNQMKSAISDAVGQSRTQAAAALSENIRHVAGLVTNLQSAQNDLDELKHAAEQTDPDVAKAKDEIDRLKADKDNIEKELRRFKGKDDRVRLDRISTVDPERVFAIETIEAGINVLEDQVDEVTNTRTLRQKRDILTRIIKSAHERAKKAIMAEIRDEANARIETLMPHNNIRIDEIDRCLVLRGQSGGSVGETLSVGYAFLSTLFDRTDEHRLPFVVDSPANPIDFDIRTNIGELVPKLTGQFIAFMISSEREKFLASLKKASNGDIQYVTLFRKGASHLESKAMDTPLCVTTNDGFRVTGEQFFNEFQLDAEEV